ncbi:ATP-binding cassette domain-containing protein [Erysipelothrix rhusiopathiae]|nr:ATP-binding cassette domain-containing protein [Erysipelothrix rhusiopathiae]MDE8332762.1 ATP-binding cassette domain-containing protein [Erysipelothrix rhusiopathiae]
MIHINNLKIQRDTLTFDIPKLNLEFGKLILVVGPNGNGKTTLLKLLSGGLKPDLGNVTIHNQSAHDYAITEGVCYIPSQFPFKTSIRLSDLGGYGEALIPNWDFKSFMQQAREMGFSNLNRIDEMSQGQRQQILYHFMMQKQSNLYLLDEPGLGLDARHLKILREDIQTKLLHEDHTVIIATNSLEHFETIADEIVLMSKGQCIVSDTVENLKDRYQGITQEEWHKTKNDDAMVGIINSGVYVIDTKVHHYERMQRLDLTPILKALLEQHENIS